MELWRKSNRGERIRVGLERVWCCLREEMWYNKEDKLEFVGE